MPFAHRVIDDHAADAQIVNPVPEFFVFLRFSAGNIARGDADHELRDAIMAATWI